MCVIVSFFILSLLVKSKIVDRFIIFMVGNKPKGKWHKWSLKFTPYYDLVPWVSILAILSTNLQVLCNLTLTMKWLLTQVSSIRQCLKMYFRGI